MTQKVHGRPQQGFWDERTVTYMNIAGDFAVTAQPAPPAAPVADPVWDVNGFAQQVLNIVQTRGTVIAFVSTSATIATIILGTSAGAFEAQVSPDTDPLVEINDQLDLIGAGYVATITEAFVGADYV